MGGIKNAYKILLENPEEERPLGRLRCRWEDDIRKDLRVRMCRLDAYGSG
jgi:hypothetical protein